MHSYKVDVYFYSMKIIILWFIVEISFSESDKRISELVSTDKVYFYDTFLTLKLESINSFVFNLGRRILGIK